MYLNFYFFSAILYFTYIFITHEKKTFIIIIIIINDYHNYAIISNYQYIGQHQLPLSFHPLRCFRGAVGAIVVYDMTNRTSYMNVEEWLTELKQYANTNINNIMLVGNKCDMIHHRVVSTDEAKQFAGM